MLARIGGCVVGVLIVRYALSIGLDAISAIFGLVVGAGAGWIAAKESE
jgi:hypothetical protein